VRNPEKRQIEAAESFSGLSVLPPEQWRRFQKRIMTRGPWNFTPQMN